MKKFYLLAGLVALLTHAPTMAFHADDSHNDLAYSAIVENGVGWLTTSTSGSNVKDDLNDSDFMTSEGSAKANIPLGNNYSTQLDLDGMHGFNERNGNDGDDYLQNYFYITNHLNWRGSDRGNLGVLLSYGEANGGADEEAQTWFYGAEGQYFYDNYTFQLQLGGMTSNDENENSVFTKAFWTRGSATYFFDDLQKLQAEISYACGKERKGTSNDEPDAIGWSWGARYDKAIHEGPLSFFLSYLGTCYKNKGPSSGSLTDHTFLVGGTLSLGAKNFRDEHKRGAGQDSIARSMGRWTAWSLNVVD